MAKVLEDYQPSTIRRYPWDEWVDGEWREAVRPDDFTCSAESFRQAIRQHACRIQYSSSVEIIDEDTVRFCIYDAEDE